MMEKTVDQLISFMGDADKPTPVILVDSFAGMGKIYEGKRQFTRIFENRLIIKDHNVNEYINMVFYELMVTNTYVEVHHSTDSDGRDTTTYTYYVWLNGIKCQISGSEYNKIGVGVYCYFIRLKAKYIKNDLFFFFPTDPAEQDHRTGQHYPEDELRLYSAPPANALATLMLVLGILGAIGSFITMVLTDDGHRTGLPVWAYIGIGCLAMAVIGFIARGISKSLRCRRIIEEKRRARQML